MHSSSLKYRIGLIFFLVLIILILGTILFIRHRKATNMGLFQVYTIYKSANGLEAGYKVRFNGIIVGLVDGVLLQGDTAVRINFSIDTVYRLFMHQNLVASVGSSGLMGDNLVDLYPYGQAEKDSPLLKPGDYVRAKQPPDYSHLLKRMQKTGTNFSKLGPAIAAISAKFTKGNGSVAQLLNNKELKTELRSTVKTARKTIRSVKKGVKI